MLDLNAYKWLHFLGLFALLMSLGGIIAAAAFGGGKKRGLFMMMHGIGLLIILVSGFGMLARLGMTQGVPGWAYGKLVIWLFLGMSPVLIKKRGQQPLLMMMMVLVAALIAAYLGIFH